MYDNTLFLCYSHLRRPTKPAVVALHVAHSLVAGEVIGSNLGPTLKTLKIVDTATMSGARHIGNVSAHKRAHLINQKQRSCNLVVT